MALHLDWQAALNKMLTAEPFDLVFLDPPYGDHLEMALLENQALYELVKPGGKLSLEHPSNYQPSATFRWELQDRNSYGETTIDLYQKSQA